MTKSTQAVTTNEALAGAQGFGTPTIVVDGKRLDDLSTVITAIDAAAK